MAETALGDKAQRGERTRRQRRRQRREPAVRCTCLHTSLVRLRLHWWEAQSAQGRRWPKTAMGPKRIQRRETEGRGTCLHTSPARLWLRW